MTPQDEIANRWFRVFERTDATQQQEEIKKILPHIAEDFLLLTSRIKELERNLADASNPFSSRYGTLTNLENGHLQYRVNGLFVDTQLLRAALEQVIKTQNLEGLSEEDKAELKRVSEIWKASVAHNT